MVRTGDHVVVSQHVAVGRNDRAGALCPTAGVEVIDRHHRRQHLSRHCLDRAIRRFLARAVGHRLILQDLIDRGRRIIIVGCSPHDGTRDTTGSDGTNQHGQGSTQSYGALLLGLLRSGDLQALRSLYVRSALWPGVGLPCIRWNFPRLLPLGVLAGYLLSAEAGGAPLVTRHLTGVRLLAGIRGMPRVGHPTSLLAVCLTCGGV
mgnify:CR=1 FL=1